MRIAWIIPACWLAFFSLGKARADFAIQTIQTNAGGSMIITWKAVPTWTYQVMYATSSKGSWQNFADGQLTASADSSTLSYTDTTFATSSCRYYKIGRAAAHVVMTLVVDHSGSMAAIYPTGGSSGSALPSAVTTFLSYFNDSTDKVALVSFSTVQSNLFYGGSPPQPAQPFKSAITTAVNALTWDGSTFSQGGLTNALVLENNATIAPHVNVIKAVVFFTDGLANTTQGIFSCPGNSLVNFGGFDSGSCIGFFDPVTGVQLGIRNDLSSCGGPVYCATTTGFPSAIDGTIRSFTRTNVTAEAQYRTIQTANAMRAAGIYVFSVGVGSAVDLTFLQEIANDPKSPAYTPTHYDGAAVLASSPSRLTAVFQQIAAKLQSCLAQ